jgi:hypothetical protein
MTLLVVGCVAFGALSYDALAGGQNPSQILLFPTYSTDNGDFAIITITNTATGTEEEGVWVRLVWIDGGEWDDFPAVKCTPEDSWVYLTPRDTFTFVDGYVNPESEEGFLYAYVVVSDEVNSKKPETDPATGNVLIGQELIFEGNSRDNDEKLMVAYGINAYGFKNLGGVNDDEYLFLDDVEFELAPHCVYFPRFFGQSGRGWDSDVILINLTGGRHFTALADVLVYNDNEVPFSTTVEFDCYDYLDIDEISNAVDNGFLRGTDHDEDEPVDGGAPDKGILGKRETGWMMFESVYATNTFLTTTIDGAAMLAVLIEMIGGGYYAAADLPWIETDGNYDNAALWSTHPDGTPYHDNP